MTISLEATWAGIGETNGLSSIMQRLSIRSVWRRGWMRFYRWREREWGLGSEVRWVSCFAWGWVVGCDGNESWRPFRGLLSIMLWYPLCLFNGYFTLCINSIVPIFHFPSWHFFPHAFLTSIRFLSLHYVPAAPIIICLPPFWTFDTFFLAFSLLAQTLPHVFNSAKDLPSSFFIMVSSNLYISIVYQRKVSNSP